MNYTIINLFGDNKSRGTFDDLYDMDKYKTIEEAWAAEDFVKCDYVKDENGIIHIEAHNVKDPDNKLYYQLQFQNCPFGIDAMDDSLACEMACKLF